MAGPAAVIPAPVSQPRRAGLLGAANVIQGDEERWGNGFAFEGAACGFRGGVGDPLTCTPASKTVSAGPDLIEHNPILIWEADQCSTFQMDTRDARARAERALLTCQGKRLETELWSGATARAASWPNRFLASLDSDVLSETPVEPRQALACLEQALAECGCGQRGMIHATPQIVSEWAAENLVVREGGLLVTANDNLVVSGAGYDGSGPPGSDDPGAPPIAADDGNIWAYATTFVEVRLSSIAVIEDLDRDVNTFTARAERLGAAYWDGCCHAGIPIDRYLCAIGGAGS